MANKSSKSKSKSRKSQKALKDYNVILRPFVKFGRSFRRWLSRKKDMYKDFKKRRPQRSFKLSKRRDLERSFKTPGYFSFAREVLSTIWSNKKLFLKFILLYMAISLIVVGTLSQESYVALRDSITSASEGLGINEMVSLIGGVMTASNSSDATIASQLVSGFLFLFGWLLIVWILRYRMANKDIKFRDALYNCGAPIAATFVLLLIVVLQLLPFVIALLVYTSVSGIGLINWSVDIENMAAWCVLAAFAVLTLYWMATSFIALIIVTVPGTYPWTAIRIAGDKVVGRRLRILQRILFMLLPILVVWIVVLIPVILLDNAIAIDWLPLIPFISLVLSTLTLLWCASYIYTLYRYLLEDNTPPVKGIDKSQKSKTKSVKKLQKK